MSPYHILSLDGGGIRGLLTIILIQRLESAQPGFLEKVELFAGTSTGAILALGLAYGLPPERIRNLYEASSQRVFADTILDDVRDLGKLIGADYSLDGLIEELTKEFEHHTLGDLNKKVLITTFDLDNNPDNPLVSRTWKAKFFHNFPGDDSDAQEKIVDVAVRSSAAPTYFPIYQGFIDGGVVATNPSISAVAQALHPAAGGQEIRGLILLSLGTGHNPRYLPQLDADWGFVQWAPHLVKLMLEGGAGLADYQARQVLDDQYLRINPVLPVPIDLDRIDQIPLLIDIANQVDLKPALRWLEKYF